MADRVGVINKGALILVEEKTALMKKLGKKQLTLNLLKPMASIPAQLAAWRLDLSADGRELGYTFDANEDTNIYSLLRRLGELSIVFTDMNTHQRTLEDIFVSLVSERA
jgi:ABC-2 type transport system ATP-binding protein